MNYIWILWRRITIELPSESTGLIILPVTGSRGNGGFGPLLAPVALFALREFSLLAEVVVDSWGNKLDATY